MGHRGAAGAEPENSLAALRAGLASGADILEFDIRLTKDNIPVLSHDNRLIKHQLNEKVADLTWAEVKKLTNSHFAPVIKLEQALDECFGKVMLNLELKPRGSGKFVMDLLESKFIKRPSDWDKFFISSFSPAELRRIRSANSTVALALLHHYNPFTFVAYNRQLNLSAVGFHRLNVNPFATQIAKQSGLFTYAYTVNRPKAALELEQQDIDGVVTDYPGKMLDALSS